MVLRHLQGWGIRDLYGTGKSWGWMGRFMVLTGDGRRRKEDGGGRGGAKEARRVAVFGASSRKGARRHSARQGRCQGALIPAPDQYVSLWVL